MKKILFGILLGLMVFQYGFTDTMDVSTPAGTDSPTEGDDRIRELKRGFVERLAVDHTVPAVGNTYDGATVGYHKKVTLPDQSGNPTNVANTSIIFNKSDGGVSSTYVEDESGNVKQIIYGDNLRLLLDEEAAAPTTAANQGGVYTKDSGTQTELYFVEESAGDEVQLTNAGAVNHGLTTDRLFEGWCNFNGAAAVPSCDDSYNITSLTDNGTGNYTITWDTNFANATYQVFGHAKRTASEQGTLFHVTARAVGTTQIIVLTKDGAAVDGNPVFVAAVGDRS